MNPAPCLLVIDTQMGLDDPGYGERNNPRAESNIATLLRRWRETKLPLVHIRHCSTEATSPLRPESPGNAFKPEAEPLDGEKVISKQVNSAFVGSSLESHLRAHGIQSLVLVGLTTDHCVSTTARTASDLGFDVTVVADATATHARTASDGTRISAETIHQVNLASLQDEFCNIATTNIILQRLSD